MTTQTTTEKKSVAERYRLSRDNLSRVITLLENTDKHAGELLEQGFMGSIEVISDADEETGVEEATVLYNDVFLIARSLFLHCSKKYVEELKEEFSKEPSEKLQVQIIHAISAHKAANDRLNGVQNYSDHPKQLVLQQRED